MEINKIFCGTDVKNTGICDCFLDPKHFTGGILMPLDRVLTAAEVADLQATLETLVRETKTNRIFPVQNFVGLTDNSEDDVNQTFGYGSVEPVREGNYNLLFGFRKGGVNLSNALRSFNGLTGKYGFIFFEAQNHLIGTLKKDADGENGIAAVPLEVLHTPKWKFNDGANLAGYGLQLGFAPHWVNENIAYVKVPKTTFLLSTLEGLEDIKLRAIESDGNEHTIGADSDCGSTDVYDILDDELAQVAAWRAKNPDTGNQITISGVVKDDVAKGWVLTLSEADPDYTEEPVIYLAPASILAAPPINAVGYESDELAIVVGS